MSPKRGDRVAPPPLKGEWDLRFGTSEAARGWTGLCTQYTANTREAFEQMRATHYQLRGSLSHREFRGRLLKQWQIKVSSSGRIWYLPDDMTRTVWVIPASPAHPKQTE